MILAKKPICDGCYICQAVIGGGIGGVTSAYYLRKLFGNKANIDVFEANKVGGRMSTIIIDGREYESGASVIHPRNQYMVNFTRMLGLKKQDPHSGKLAIFNGEEFVFVGSDYSWITIAKMFWRYGMDIYNIDSWVQEQLTKFDRIYQHQEDGIAFSTVEGLLESMDPSFVEYTKTTIRDVMKKNGFSEKFIDELVTAGLNVNYGQGTEIHGFVGAIGLAGFLPGLWSVRGGNRQVPEKLLTASDVNFIHAEVTRVALERDENNNVRYDLSFMHSGLPEGSEAMEIDKQYDVVVVAAPLHHRVSDIVFEGFPKPIHYLPEEFQRTVANFARGFPNSSYFGPSCPGDFPTAVLCNNLNLFFNSFAKQSPVSGIAQMDEPDAEKGPVWKIFSSHRLSSEELNDMYVKYQDAKFVDWLAYPQYKATETLPSFVLYDQLYYVNAIEMAASAIEMSAIAGRNVATLAFNHWLSLFDKIDEVKSASDGEQDSRKSEL